MNFNFLLLDAFCFSQTFSTVHKNGASGLFI